MSRHEGDPVPHEHQFYRTTLKGLFSLDLHAAGAFSYRNKTGFRNLDDVRIELAEEKGLEHVPEEKSYRLPYAERVQRIAALFDGMSRLEGGAKQALHYTDVTPAFVILAVTKGGNHIFGHVIGANRKGLPVLNIEALKEALTVFSDDLLSDVYFGWTQGYLDEERDKLEAALAEDGPLNGYPIHIFHPRQAFQAFIEDLQSPENAHWLE
jgi:CRISPR-associated protein Cst2